MTATLIYTLQFDVPKQESWLKMVLSAPLCFFGSMAHDPSTMQLIWDSGASVSITPNKNDFVSTLDKVPNNIKLNGLAKGLEIAGAGSVEWNVLDTKGHLHTLKLPAYYIPKNPVHLLSTTSLLQTYLDETILIQPHELNLSGIESAAPLLPGTPVNDSLRVLPTPITMVTPSISFGSLPQSAWPYDVLSSPFNPCMYPDNTPHPSSKFFFPSPSSTLTGVPSEGAAIVISEGAFCLFSPSLLPSWSNHITTFTGNSSEGDLYTIKCCHQKAPGNNTQTPSSYHYQRDYDPFWQSPVFQISHNLLKHFIFASQSTQIWI